MTKQIRLILVAIGDISHVPKNQLGKAGALAKPLGARIELFHAIDEPDPGRSYPETATKEPVERQRAAITAKTRGRLERLARDASLRGVTVVCTAAWDRPAYDAIVRRAVVTRADLVIAATHGHRFGARLVLRNTDWELIRHCPVPVLLIKSRRAYHKPVVLAAVDPFHAHAKPADLDSRVLATASQFARLLHGTVHVFHAYMPLISGEPAPVGAAPLMMLPPAAEMAHGRQIARAIDRLADTEGIPRTRRHIHMGDVAGELSTLTRRTHTHLVVMGAVSRSALVRVFIGNTAERVLDRLSCDVLVVKPRGFKSVVSRSVSASHSAKPARPSARWPLAAGPPLL